MPKELEASRPNPRPIARASSESPRRLYLKAVAPVLAILAVGYLVLLVGKGSGKLDLTYEAITEYMKFARLIALLCTGVVAPELVREVMNFYHSFKD